MSRAGCLVVGIRVTESLSIETTSTASDIQKN